VSDVTDVIGKKVSACTAPAASSASMADIRFSFIGLFGGGSWMVDFSSWVSANPNGRFLRPFQSAPLPQE
jgi:hypothetical protein